MPTLCIIKSQLLELLDRPAPLSLTICQSLVRALLDGINSRFGTVFDDTKVQRASALHPKFKLNCVENQVHKSLAVEQLKPAVEIENRSEKMQQDCRAAFARESHQDQPQVTAATPAKDFFACITSKRNATVPLLGQMQMLRWNHIFLLPNFRPWKPIQISAKFT